MPAVIDAFAEPSGNLLHMSGSLVTELITARFTPVVQVGDSFSAANANLGECYQLAKPSFELTGANRIAAGNWIAVKQGVSQLVNQYAAALISAK